MELFLTSVSTLNDRHVRMRRQIMQYVERQRRLMEDQTREYNRNLDRESELFISFRCLTRLLVYSFVVSFRLFSRLVVRLIDYLFIIFIFYRRREKH